MQPSHTVTGSGSGDAVHAQRPPLDPRSRRALAVALAVLVAAGAAVVALAKTPADTSAGPASAKAITGSPRIPLAAAELIDLTRRPPEYGRLADPKRRAACLRALDYPDSVPILGARTVGAGDAATVVLVVAGTGPDDLVGLQVRADCGAGPGGLVARTGVRRS